MNPELYTVEVIQGQSLAIAFVLVFLCAAWLCVLFVFWILRPLAKHLSNPLSKTLEAEKATRQNLQRGGGSNREDGAAPNMEEVDGHQS